MKIGPTTRLARATLALSLALLGGCGGTSGDTLAALPVVTAPAEQNPAPTVQTAAKVPDVPAAASALAGTNKLTLSWSAASGATSYCIYWSTAPGVTTAGGTKVTASGASYIHRGLPPSTSYYYRVTALNSYGESAPTDQFAATTATADGSLPYAAYCAVCHRDLALSTITNAGLPQIEAALQSVSAMSNINLTGAQLSAIDAALTNDH